SSLRSEASFLLDGGRLANFPPLALPADGDSLPAALRDPARKSKRLRPSNSTSSPDAAGKRPRGGAPSIKRKVQTRSGKVVADRGDSEAAEPPTATPADAGDP
ncbi:unnamed protein product, partial [Laminaria digitata]